MKHGHRVRTLLLQWKGVRTHPFKQLLDIFECIENAVQILSLVFIDGLVAATGLCFRWSDETFGHDRPFRENGTHTEEEVDKLCQRLTTIVVKRHDPIFRCALKCGHSVNDGIWRNGAGPAKNHPAFIIVS